MLRGATALTAAGGGEGKPWRPGTWPGGGSKPLGAMPGGEAADAAREAGWRADPDGRLEPRVFFLEPQSGTEGGRPPSRTQGHSRPPREAGPGLQRRPQTAARGQSPAGTQRETPPRGLLRR